VTIAAALAAALLVLAQTPQAPVAAETKARADLAHAAQHVDRVPQLAGELRDRAKAAQALAEATAKTATELDRARLASLASDLGAQLATLQQTLTAQSEAIRTARLGIDAELPNAAEGTVPWFRERALATGKLPTHKDAITELRKIERDVLADAVKKQPGGAGVASHVRYLLAEALREDAETQARDRDTDNAILRFADAWKKFDEVLRAADVSDTGAASSLHALALRRQVEIDARLYLTYQPLVQQKPDLASKANHHRKRAEDAFDRLQRAHGSATMPNGELVGDAARAAVDRLRAR